MKSTVLFSSSAPGIPGVGGVLVQDMLDDPAIGPIDIAAIVKPDWIDRISPEFADRVTTFEPIRERYDSSLKGKWGTVRRLLERRRRYDPATKQIAGEFRKYIRAKDPAQLWVILNSTTVIDVIWQCLSDLNCDLLVQIWDDPQHLCVQRNCDQVTTKRTMERFHAIMKRAKRTGVICEQAVNAYKPLTDNDLVIIRHGMDSEGVSPNATPADPDEFRIGLSGSMYCDAEWRCLQAACDSVEWKIAGRQIVLVIAGGKIEFQSRSTADCRFYGWRQLAEVQSLMSECDCLYLPQSSAPQDRVMAELSFPTKLSTYATTGRPILIHTPQYGSLTPFCQEHDFGVLCNSLRPADLARYLTRLATNSGYYQEQCAATCRIAQSVLTSQTFRDGIHRFLGIQVESN